MPVDLHTTRLKNSRSVPPEDCVFCKIVNRSTPSALVYEDNAYVAFLDRAPFSAGHTLVCPKKHGETVNDMTESEIGGLFALAARLSKSIVAATSADGFRFVQNNGEAANQVVPHVHVHVIPVKMSQKGIYMDRSNPTMAQLQETAKQIRSFI